MSRGAIVIVAGAGALGLSCALALADAGCSVTVCDPAGAPQASTVAAGMLAPVFEAVLDDGGEAAFNHLIAARDLWPGLEVRAGVALDRSGAMAVGEAAWLAGVARGLAKLGVRPTELPRTTIEGLAPGLAPAFDHALLVREDWRLEPRQALAALRRAAQAAGVLFRRDLAEATFGVSAGVRAATADGLPMVGPSSAAKVVLAVGARRNGWLLAPLVAQMVAACVVGRDLGPYAARFDPQRLKDGRFDAQ
jgi:glycine oxidase